MARIGFIGLGNMGAGMATNLIRAGHDVKLYDLNPDAIRKLVEVGGIAANSLAEVSSNAQIIVTMLPAGSHVLQTYFSETGVASTAPKGTLFIDCSTIAVEDARKASRQALELGFDMVDAPVSGGTAGANAGTLTFMVGAEAEPLQRAKSILEAMGKNIFHAGPSGNGQAAKIANNMLLGISMIATSEAFKLAESLGLDAQTFFDISSKSSGQCWSMTTYCPVPGPVPTSPANRDYAAGFAVGMMLKDLHLAQAAALASGSHTPMGAHATRLYEILASKNLSEMDFSVIANHLESN